MSRRSLTLALSGAFLVALVAMAMLLPVPYVIYSPGPIENTLGTYNGKQVITVPGQPTYPTGGALDLTTVGVTRASSDVGLGTALRAWVDPRLAVMPRELVYPKGQTPQQAEQENAEAMTTSQDSATVAALRFLGNDVPSSPVVSAIVKGSPAVGHLQAGDSIKAVDGQAITQADQVGDAVRKHQPGDVVAFSVVRKGTPTAVSVTTVPTKDKPAVASVGISVGEGYTMPFEVSINLGQDIGGPSAGTMFALGIIDTLTPGKLNGGKQIAGTGTMSADGKVGAIGGIPQKIVAAKEDGAIAFLVPGGNCDEARTASNGSMRLVKIDTLQQAHDAVEAIGKGQTKGLASCAG